MDVCLIKLSDNGNGKYKLVFSGAKRNLYHVDKYQDELNITRGDRRSIGGIITREKNMPFQDHELDLEKGDTLYLDSDGFVDQNDPGRKRFGSKKLVALLNEISALPLEEQESKLREALSNHQKGEEQRDDITLMGIRLR
jgi:hypothetical protein